MILLSAVAIGLFVGLLRAKGWGRHLAFPPLRGWWLVWAAFSLQGVAFSFHPIRQWIPDSIASVILVISQTLTMSFFAANWKQHGFPIGALGVGLNLLVILVNGGFMPISPETVTYLVPNAPIDSWQIGERLGWGKDIVLSVQATHGWIFSDHLRTPAWFPYKVAFSLGDVLMAIGVAWSLWSLGKRKSQAIYLVEKYDPTQSLI
jgi:hypothetical protein